MNDFFARNRLTFRVNLVLPRGRRLVYSAHDRQYLNALFHHNLGWINGYHDEGCLAINIGILNLWSILEFLDRK